MSQDSCKQHPQCQSSQRAVTVDGKTMIVDCCMICLAPFDAEIREKLQAEQKPEPVTIRSFANYRAHASRTDANHPLAYYAGGLCEEAGEIWGVLKKAIWHGHKFDRDKILRELGDGLWLLDQLAKHLGFTLEEVASANIAHLWKRYPDGFSKEASRNREAAE